MYSLFDTLRTIHCKKSIDENILNILMRPDIDVMTLTTTFYFDTERSIANNNCLILACWRNINLPLIKYLIEECKMDVNHINYTGENCLTMACMKNTNLQVIKYLIEERKMNIDHVNQNNTNCLAMACLGNTNLQVIKYLTEEQKMDIKHYHDNINYLMRACLGNTNLAIIKYLIEDHKININHVARDNDNCLTAACWNNTNLAIIKYLIEEHKMNIDHVNQNNDDCLAQACQSNTNLAIIKYLIEEHKMNIDHVNQYNDNCLALACRENKNLEVIKYLIKEHKMKIEKLDHVSYGKFKDIILTISKEYRNLNDLLLMGYEKYENDKMKNLIELINPLQLNYGVLDLAGMQNPLLDPGYKFSKFAILTDIYLQFLNENTELSDTVHVHCSQLYCHFKECFKNNNPNSKIPSNKEFINNIKKYKDVIKIKINGITQLGIRNLNLIA
jgi:NADH:ubiquinone oxidoreductase subunit E